MSINMFEQGNIFQIIYAVFVFLISFCSSLLPSFS